MSRRLFLAVVVAGVAVPGRGLAQSPPAPVPAAVEAIRVALQKGDLDGAVAAGEKAAAASPGEEAKEPARAEAEYRKAIEADPKQLRGRLALSGLLVKGKRAPEARELWQQFSKTNPDQTYGHYALARMSVLTGEDLAGGVEHLKAYLATPPKPDTPTWADAHWRLSNLYEKMGRGDDAKAELREALRLNPDHASAKKDLKRLEG
jgi:tetratricopeptide (TPR) repeat protein